MKKLSILFFTLILCLCSIDRVFGVKPLDRRIFSEAPQNTYVGIGEGKEMIKNLNFDDVPGDFWAKESITRSGALNMIKGYDNNFYPNDIISNQDALTFVIRAIGMEKEAEDRAVLIEGQAPVGSDLNTTLALGYLNIAQEIGLITGAQYNDAQLANQETLNPDTNFIREAAAKKEDVADWIVKGLLYISPEVFDNVETQQNIYQYIDWKDLSVDKMKSMESALKTGIFQGNGERLDPQGNLTRAEMAQTLKNMDKTHYDLVGITKKIGTIGGIRDSQSTTTESAYLSRDFYIRNQDGKIDIIKFQMSENSSSNDRITDSVVLRNGQVVGLSQLEQGDKLEYLVRPTTGEVVYVQVLDTELENKNLKGVLKSVDISEGLVTIVDISDKTYTYPLNQDLYGLVLKNGGNANNDVQEYYVLMDNKEINVNELPLGNNVSLALQNGIVSSMTFEGNTRVVVEEMGLVTENNPSFGYLTYIDHEGNHVTKNYRENEIEIEKQQYFETDDEIGYIDQIFPSFKFDKKDTDIRAIEVGDVVSLRFDPRNADNIISISSKPNYSIKHGEILEITNNGSYSSIVFEFEDGQTALFNVANDIYVSKDGETISISSIKEGDFAKILVNEQVFSSDAITESIKEMVIEGDEHYIETIVKGHFSGIDKTQDKLSLQNPQILTNEGWEDIKDLETYDISDESIEFFKDSEEISSDYASKYLMGKENEVYIAIFNDYSGEKIAKVTFRSERDELLRPDIINSNINGEFSMLSAPKPITTDKGTIIRRNGRLVGGDDIESADYAVVSLNGDSRAAVVDINPMPNASNLDIITARILSIDDGKSFKVKSIASLKNNVWEYAPIERIFTIDYDTLFLNNLGVVDENTFKTYGENSYLDKVVNIVSAGTHAERVILGNNSNENVPYARHAIRGTIYTDMKEDTNQEEEKKEVIISIKDVDYLEESTGNWIPISKKNPIAKVRLGKDAIIVNNILINDSDLKSGQQIRVMTEKLPEKINAPIDVDGRVIHVEK